MECRPVVLVLDPAQRNYLGLLVFASSLDRERESGSGHAPFSVLEFMDSVLEILTQGNSGSLDSTLQNRFTRKCHQLGIAVGIRRFFFLLLIVGEAMRGGTYIIPDWECFPEF
jgi:hypothetical protein